MSENVNTETMPADHDEDICSGGATMCHECYAASDDEKEMNA
jgi:hypothetical protein